MGAQKVSLSHIALLRRAEGRLACFGATSRQACQESATRWYADCDMGSICNRRLQHKEDSVLHESALILLAEDNSAIRMLLHEILEDEGYIVTCCASASDAIEKLQYLTPVLVISDMQMEHVAAGLQLLRRMRDNPTTAATPVIIYSADGLLLRTLQEQIQALNAVPVEKPFDVDRLVTLAQRLIALKDRGTP
jgi:CheY-like chemotaxis protein